MVPPRAHLLAVVGMKLFFKFQFISTIINYHVKVNIDIDSQ